MKQLNLLVKTGISLWLLLLLLATPTPCKTELSKDAAMRFQHLLQEWCDTFQLVGAVSGKCQSLHRQAADACLKGDNLKALALGQAAESESLVIEARLLNIPAVLNSLESYAHLMDLAGFKKMYQEQLRVSREAKIQTTAAIASAYVALGKPREAANAYLQSLELLEAESRSTTNSLLVQKVKTLYELANAFMQAGEADEAHKYIDRALQLAPNCVYCLQKAAELSMSENNPMQAARYLSTAANAVHERSKPEVLAQLSRALIASGQAERGAQTLREAIQLYSEVPKEQRKAETPQYFGIAETALGNYPAALRHLSDVIASAEKYGYVPSICECRLYRALCCQRLGDTDGALADLKAVQPYLRELPFLEGLSAKLAQELKFSLDPPPIQQKWALLIGIGNFADDTIPKLQYASKDARDIQQLLIRDCGFRQDHIRVLTDKDATKNNILELLGDKWLPQTAGINDLVFIFVSSHGTPANKDIGALNYVVTYDTKKDHLFTTGIPMQQISDLIAQRIKARRAFVVVDTCYSGGTGLVSDLKASSPTEGNVDISRMVTSSTQLVLCASSTSQRSWESMRYPNGVFTRQLINCLTTNRSYDDFHKVFSTVASNVEAEVSKDHNTMQTPTIAGRWNGKGLLD